MNLPGSFVSSPDPAAPCLIINDDGAPGSIAQENHLMILCSFFFVIVILVPMTFICYYQNSRNFAVNGDPRLTQLTSPCWRFTLRLGVCCDGETTRSSAQVMIETLQFLGPLGWVQRGFVHKFSGKPMIWRHSFSIFRSLCRISRASHRQF